MLRRGGGLEGKRPPTASFCLGKKKKRADRERSPRKEATLKRKGKKKRGGLYVDNVWKNCKKALSYHRTRAEGGRKEGKRAQAYLKEQEKEEEGAMFYLRGKKKKKGYLKGTFPEKNQSRKFERLPWVGEKGFVRNGEARKSHRREKRNHRMFGKVSHPLNRGGKKGRFP